MAQGQEGKKYLLKNSNLSAAKWILSLSAYKIFFPWWVFIENFWFLATTSSFPMKSWPVMFPPDERAFTVTFALDWSLSSEFWKQRRIRKMWSLLSRKQAWKKNWNFGQPFWAWKKQVQWITPVPADSESLIYQQSSKRANIINKNPVDVACSIYKLEIYWYHSFCMFIEWPENDSQVIHPHYIFIFYIIESISITSITGLHNNVIILHLAWSYQVCT